MRAHLPRDELLREEQQQQREGSLARAPATGEAVVPKPTRTSPSDSAVSAKASSLERTRASEKADRSSLPKASVPSPAAVSSSSSETATVAAGSPDAAISSRAVWPAQDIATNQAAAAPLLVAEASSSAAVGVGGRIGTQTSSKPSTSSGRTPPQVPLKPTKLQLRATGSVPAQQPYQAAAAGGPGSPSSSAWSIAALSAHTIVRLSRDLMLILTSKGIIPQYAFLISVLIFYRFFALMFCTVARKRCAAQSTEYLTRFRIQI